MYKFIPKPVLYKQLRKSKTLPDQAMSVETILSRYTRGVPVNVARREEVFIDQDEYDFEAMARMSFADKADLAESLRARAKEIERRMNDARELEKEQREAFEQSQAQAQAEARNIDPLDNTMLPDTTSPNSGGVSRKKKGGADNG